MRKLKAFDSEREAKRLVDRLLLADIDSQVRGDQPWEVWVLDDHRMDAARRELEHFAGGSAPDPAPAAAQRVRKQRARDDENAAERFVPVGAGWHESDGQGPGIEPLTVFLILVSLVVAAFTHASWDAPGLALRDPLIQQLSIEPWSSGEFLGRVQAGEVWRLLTPMFIHFGIVHLLFNMVWLWQLGREIEHRHGLLALLGLVLISEIPGGIGQYLASGPNYGGMSGVVYGLFGFVWMQTRYNRVRRYQLRSDTAVFMMIWFVLCLGGLVGPIANVGHAGGLVAGLLAGVRPYVRHLRDRASNPALRAGGWVGELRGAQALRKRVLEPFVPLWLLLIAGVALVIEFWPG